MRPDRNWRGLDTYRRQWQLIWQLTPDSRFEVISAAVVGSRGATASTSTGSPAR